MHPLYSCFTRTIPTEGVSVTCRRLTTKTTIFHAEDGEEIHRRVYGYVCGDPAVPGQRVCRDHQVCDFKPDEWRGFMEALRVDALAA
jgi:hypothetical protein